MVVALSDPPLKEGRGAGRCALAMLRGLPAHGISVRAIAARAEWGMRGDPPEDLGVEVIDVPPEPPGWGSRLRRLWRPYGQLARSEFGQRVRDASRHTDVLHLEEFDTFWCGEGVTVPTGVRIHYLLRRDRSLGPPWRREFLNLLEVELAERVAIKRSRLLLAASPLVAEELARRASGGRVELVPFCLDPEDYPPASLEGPPTAGFIGTAVWPPTASAISALVTEVWPRVRQDVPQARLLVAGRGTSSLLDLSSEGNVEVLGEVPSGREFLRGLSVLVYPVERGSGVKVKVLEAIASGVPVVTTPAGAEGIEAGDGIVIATDARSLAGATASLLRDEGERHQRGEAARAAFLERYSPVPATEPLAILYRAIAEETGGSPP
jgi:glycosyltransferase involved in cell wall biosynthesis